MLHLGQSENTHSSAAQKQRLFSALHITNNTSDAVFFLNKGRDSRMQEEGASNTRFNRIVVCSRRSLFCRNTNRADSLKLMHLEHYS